MTTSIEDWFTDPLESIKKAFCEEHDLRMEHWLEDRIVDVRWGEIVVDMTDDLDVDGGRYWASVLLGEEPEDPTGFDMLADNFPVLIEHVEECPACEDPVVMYLHSLVQHLNDDHEYTRLQIADWLEALDIDMEIQCTA